ncbi:radical SAM protein [Candidatus Woesearchaeota archaeon]|nr:radical SAM protein [Candidatus Woesearchaeota archaeon]
MLSYGDLVFEQRENETLRVTVYRLFYRDFSADEIAGILGEFQVNDGKLQAEGFDEAHIHKKFMQFFRKYKRDLRYKLNGNRAVYVDEDLGLPLVGLQFLGIADKGSEILELKPITNCNADCVFCSVNEGPSSNKQVDFVVDKDYLVQQTKELLALKESGGMSLWINPHGEPTLYAKLTELCEDLLQDEHVKDIHVITNGMLLTSGLVDKLVGISGDAQKQIHISLSMSGLGTGLQPKSKSNKQGLAANKLMMGESYNLQSVLRNLEYVATKLPVTITPVYVHGMNDEEIENLILLSKKYPSVNIMIQKFCENKRGRNPIVEEGWDAFFAKMKNWEKKTSVNLTKTLGKIQQTKELPPLCKKKDRITVEILCSGRYLKERLGVLKTKEGVRAVCVLGCSRDSGTLKAEVLSAKHNMILAKGF